MGDSYATLEIKELTGILTINRTSALNALNHAVIAELGAALEHIRESELRCLVITGAGEKAFVAGADIAEMKEMNPAEAEAFSVAGNIVMNQIEQLSMPVIAAVNGYALGGGCELALACDIRIASEKAVFGFPEVTLGVLPGYGGVQRLVRLVGLAKAKELIFTADRVTAGEALSMGLVNMVVKPSVMMETALGMAEKIARNSPVGIQSTKRIANKSVGCELRESLYLEVKSFGACFGTQDQKNAMSAFLEKQKPQPFTGK